MSQRRACCVPGADLSSPRNCNACPHIDDISDGFELNVINGGAGGDQRIGSRSKDQFTFEGAFGDDKVADFGLRINAIVAENFAAADPVILIDGDDTLLIASGAEIYG